jgi:phage terminase small subunit
MGKEKTLTAKQKLFCKEYTVDLNATQAAIRAGYSEKTAYSIGHENLSKPEIAEKIQQYADKRSKRVEISADYVLTSLQAVAERCMQAEPVMAYNDDTKQQEETGEYSFQHAGANKALELLGKNLKLFTDKHDVKVDGLVFNMNFGNGD